MTIELKMPALSPTMSEGKIARWLVKEGDSVSSGDVVAEIETDKATMEYEVADEGVVGKILVPEGTEGVAVNTPIAVLLEEGEDASAAAGVGKAPAAPVPAAKAEEKPAKPAAPAPQPAAAPAAADTDRIFASPLARRMAGQAGLDLSGVKGSGPNGRIVKSDIEAALTAKPAAAPAAKSEPASVPAAKAEPAPAVAPKAAPTAPAKAPAAAVPDTATPYTEVPLSKMRKIIARRLTESKQMAPHFYLTVDCRIDDLLAMRSELNGRAPEGEGAYKLSVNDFIVRAVALAMRKVPAVNVSWTDSAILQYQRIDVSVAVATPSGLITPIVRDAGSKGLAAISTEMKDLGKRAREGKLMPEEYQGGGFTISNMGMYGVRDFAAIINPPQSAILAVGAGEQRPVVKDGALAIATVMTCTISVDHRAVDGAVAAEFMAAFKKLIEEPLTMLL